MKGTNGRDPGGGPAVPRCVAPGMSSPEIPGGVSAWSEARSLPTSEPIPLNLYADMRVLLSRLLCRARRGRLPERRSGDLSLVEDGVSRARPPEATRSRPRAARPPLPAAAALLLLSACVAGEERGPTVGAAAPSFGATTLTGDSISLADLGGKVVLLNFWATWCAPCRHETPFLDSLHAQRGPDGLEVLGVSLDAGDARGDVVAFVEEYGVGYTILVDPQMRAMDRYKVLGLPASFLVDREGILRWMRYGPVSATDREFLDALESVLQ